MSTYNLYHWSISDYGIPYAAPEQLKRCLVGFRDEERSMVRTSPYIKVNGRTVITVSGSIYILKNIDLDYLKFIVENGFDFDPNNPIKIKE